MKRVFDRGNGELENAEGSQHESVLNLKWLFRMLSFYHKQNKALFFLQDEGVAQSILDNFGFYRRV